MLKLYSGITPGRAYGAILGTMSQIWVYKCMCFLKTTHLDVLLLRWKTSHVHRSVQFQASTFYCNSSSLFCHIKCYFLDIFAYIFALLGMPLCLHSWWTWLSIKAKQILTNQKWKPSNYLSWASILRLYFNDHPLSLFWLLLKDLTENLCSQS